MMELNLTPFPNLATERLLLRQLEPADEKEIFELRSDIRVNEFLDRPKAGSLDDARKFIAMINDGIRNNELAYWAVTLKNKQNVAGTICYWNISKENYAAEIGYELHPKYHGMGIMNEALSKVIEFGFAVWHLKVIQACTHTDNLRSVKLLERNGFSRETCKDEKEANALMYSLRAGKR